MTRLWLVRHGPTHAREMIGWTDRAADLSDSAKIARLAAALPGGARLVSSDLSRAVQTADTLPGQRLPHDARLREIHFGAWEGRRFAEVEADTPDLIRTFWEQAGDVAAPGGESWNAMAARVCQAVDGLLTGGDLIIVAHFGPILALLQRAQGVDVQTVFAQKIEPLSLTQLRFDGTWQVGPINHDP